MYLLIWRIVKVIHKERDRRSEGETGRRDSRETMRREGMRREGMRRGRDEERKRWRDGTRHLWSRKNVCSNSLTIHSTDDVHVHMCTYKRTDYAQPGRHVRMDSIQLRDVINPSTPYLPHFQNLSVRYARQRIVRTYHPSLLRTYQAARTFFVYGRRGYTIQVQGAVILVCAVSVACCLRVVCVICVVCVVFA